MAVVVVRQHLLAGCLAVVVQLLADALAQLVDQRVDVLARHGDLQHPAQQGDVVQVSGHRLGDAGVLHLDRDSAAVAGDGPVHLADRGGGDGLGIPLGEHLLRRLAQFLSDDAGGQLGRHRRDAVLEPAERAADRRSQAVIDVAGHLAQLDQYAAHRAEGGRDVLRGLQGKVAAQLLAVLAGGGEQLRRVAGVPGAAAHHQGGGGQPPAQPQPADPAAHADDGQRGSGHGGQQAGGPGAAAHARCAAARIRTAIRCRASSTPGSPRYTVSRTPSAWRISVRRSGVSGATW